MLKTKTGLRAESVESETRPGPHDGDLEVRLQSENGLYLNDTTIHAVLFLDLRDALQNRNHSVGLLIHISLFAKCWEWKHLPTVCAWSPHRRVLCTLISQWLQVLLMSMWNLGACCLVSHIENYAATSCLCPNLIEMCWGFTAVWLVERQ